MFNGNLLGSQLANLNPAYIPVPAGEVVYSADYKWINIAAVHVQGAAVAAETVSRYVAAVLTGVKPLTMGQALAGGLRGRAALGQRAGMAEHPAQIGRASRRGRGA